MENQIFFVIIMIIIVIIYYIHINYNSQTTINENFDINENNNLLSLNPNQRCKTLGVNKFMIRDLRTKLWLTSGQNEGFNKFLPGRFGVSLMMSENPNEYLPLRTVSDPNDYLLATYSGEGIRTITNPYTQYFIIQIYIYNYHNILGYIKENEETVYLYIDDNGNILSTSNPDEASKIEIIEI